MTAPRPTGPTANDQTLQVYKAYLEDLGRLGSRHETLRQFYITVVSALFTFLGLAGTTGVFGTVREGVQHGIGLIGAMLCVLWALHMWSYGTLFKAKRAVLEAGEGHLGLPYKPFTLERTYLRPILPKETTDLNAAARRYPRITVVDRWIAVIFFILFIGTYVL